MDASDAQIAHRKHLKRRGGEGGPGSSSTAMSQHEPEEEGLEHLHVKQVLDLLAWHIRVVDARWDVKPRSTCWFEEYLFNIYTLDMFYDILRMRRRTFDRLVNDLRPFIQGHHTHWREPIGVEKNWWLPFSN